MTRQLIWVDGQKQIIDYTPTPEDIQEALENERRVMRCTPLQGKLALGEERWGVVEEYKNTEATWAQIQIIESASEWKRTSDNILFFQYILNLSDEETDDLFRLAKTIDA